jgi:hypothetical protein
VPKRGDNMPLFGEEGLLYLDFKVDIRPKELCRSFLE